MEICSKSSLRDFNSFGLEATAYELLRIDSITQLPELMKKLKLTGKWLILGGGSNILLRNNFPGLVVINELKGKKIIDEMDNAVQVEVASGENWHDFVCWSLNQGYFGLENLSLIPGTVGAAPIQNIGAYGVELEQYFKSLQAIDLSSGEQCNFNHRQCHFGYRDSFFKSEPDRFLITAVSFQLSKNHNPVLNYPGVRGKLSEIGTDMKNPTALEISDVICALRTNKLPAPKIMGNVGSFFKNPIISVDVYTRLLKTYTGLSSYKLSENAYKISAAWMVEQCGWKGFRIHDVGVYDKHALVIVNYGNATGAQIWRLAMDIRESVFDKFEIMLEIEPRII